MAKRAGNKVTAYYRQLHHQCVEALQGFVQSASEEDLHTLRVSIKRLDALFWAVNKLSNNFQRRKQFTPYRRLFKQAGIIRDAQVQLQLLPASGQGKELKPVATHLQNQISIEQKKFVSAAPEIQLQLQKSALALPAFFNQVHVKEFSTLTDKLIKKQQKRWRKLPAEKKLHAARKPVKHVLYLNEFLAKQDKDLLRRKQVKHWDNLQKAIGDLHDRKELISLLRRKEFTSIKQQLRQQISQLHKKVSGIAAKIAR